MTFDHKEASEKLVELYPSAREAIRYNNTLNPAYITQDIGKLMKLVIESRECFDDCAIRMVKRTINGETGNITIEVIS